ncbi:MAG: hypothetical protein AB8B77_01025 [Alphaproteobacteria bacterium]
MPIITITDHLKFTLILLIAAMFFGGAASPSTAQDQSLFLDQQQAILTPSCAADHYIRTGNVVFADMELAALITAIDAAPSLKHQALLKDQALQATEMIRADDDPAQARAPLAKIKATLAEARAHNGIFTHSDALTPLFDSIFAFREYVRAGPDFTDLEASALFMYRLGRYDSDLALYLNHLAPSGEQDAHYQRLITILKADMAHLHRAFETKNSPLVVNIVGEMLSAARLLRFQYC